MIAEGITGLRRSSDEIDVRLLRATNADCCDVGQNPSRTMSSYTFDLYVDQAREYSKIEGSYMLVDLCRKWRNVMFRHFQRRW